MLKRKCAGVTKSNTKLLKHSGPTATKNCLQKSVPQSCLLSSDPNFSPYCLHLQLHSTISSYLKDYKKRIASKHLYSDSIEKTIVIQGPAGCGKTSFVRNLALDLSLKILELGASSLRNNMTVRRVLGEASQTFSIDQGENIGTIIFIDDVDIQLEPDKGFFKGIEAIIGDTKCPIIMTCEVLPEIFFHSKSIKLYKIENYKDRALEMFSDVKNRLGKKISSDELENCFNQSRGNMHRISMCIQMEVIFNQDIGQVYGTQVKVVGPSSVKLVNPEGIFERIFNDQGLYLANYENSLEFMSNLQEIDIIQSNRKNYEIEINCQNSAYFDKIERFYLENRDPEESFEMSHRVQAINFQAIARQHLLHMSETVDYISFLQIIQEFPAAVQTSYFLRQNKKNQNYLEVFLLKNPKLSGN